MGSSSVTMCMAFRLIHSIYESGQGRRFSTSSGTSDQDQAIFLLSHLMKDFEESQVIDAENLCAQFSQYNGIRIPLLKNIDAEASLANQSA